MGWNSELEVLEGGDNKMTTDQESSVKTKTKSKDYLEL